MSLVNAALAGAPRGPVAAAARSAFVIGNVGKLGGELLNVLLESPRYERVCVGVGRPMRSYLPKLESLAVPEARADWNPCAGMPWVPEDAYLCIDPPAKSFWKVAKPYVELSSEWAVALALRLRAGGARRVAVITPLEALLQMGAAPVIRDGDELAIFNAGFERMLVLRPVEEGRRTQASGLFGKIGGVVTQTLGSYMTPKGLQPVRVRRAAQVAVDQLAAMADGMQVIGAERLRELAGDPLAAKS